MKTSQKTEVGFDFQTIDLKDAVNMVMAGDGNYADLKAKLLEALPTLPPDKAFVFGQKGQELPEDQRRGICMAINNTFKKAGTGWKVTYSGARKLFVCIPRNGSPMPRGPYKKEMKRNSGGAGKDLRSLVELAGTVFGIPAKDIFGKAKTPEIRHVQKAIQVVAFKKCDIDAKQLGKAFSITPHGVDYNVRTGDKQIDKVTKLIKAL